MICQDAKLSRTGAYRRYKRSLATLLLCLAPLVVGADMIDRSGMAEWEICALCHSADGVSVMARFPKLAGQKASYIERQVKQFRLGERSNDGGQMQAISTEVEWSAVPQIAAYFAGLDTAPTVELTPQAMSGNEPLAEQFKRGKTLFYGGDGATPACATCHADPRSPAPWLDGQHRDYLYKQLQDFRSGRRSDSILGKMPVIAARLSESDMAAVSAFLAAIQLQRN